MRCAAGSDAVGVPPHPAGARQLTVAQLSLDIHRSGGAAHGSLVGSRVVNSVRLMVGGWARPGHRRTGASDGGPELR
jgi:hypothetical protein